MSVTGCRIMEEYEQIKMDFNTESIINITENTINIINCFFFFNLNFLKYTLAEVENAELESNCLKFYTTI